MVTAMEEDDRDIDNDGKNENEKDNENSKANCCKKFVKFMFSHIGLMIMVVAYSVAGGFIFEHLEATNEKQECVKAMNKYFPMENSTVIKLWEVAKIFCDDKDDDEKAEQANVEIQKLLEKFRDDVLELGYGGTNCTSMGEPGGPGFQWSFSGALLFSVTVITTIGYGNIAPKTFWGRLVCIAYAVLGIPLMLLCLANIGDVMADIFRYVYSKICCCGCCRKKRKKNEDNMEERETTPEAWKKTYNQDKVEVQW
jgi:potassium channel subfamily K protein